MPHIVVENLVKTFRIAQRRPGIWGALKGIVHRQYREVRALDGISDAPLLGTHMVQAADAATKPT